MRKRILLLLTVITVIYLVIGGLAFFLLERNNEQQVGDDIQAIVNKFLATNPSISAQNLSNFVQAMSTAYAAGFKLSDNGTVTQPAPVWDFHSSLFFSITVITTIGYGNISPKTVGGRVFFIFYALIGIPLLAVLLGGLSAKVGESKARLEAFAVARCCGEERQSRTKFVTVVGTLLYTLIGAVLFLALPALIFSFIEQWEYGDAFYYAFVTLSTVGFGDYVAGQQEDSILLKLSLVLWIFSGIIYISGIISCIQSVIESQAASVVSDDSQSDGASEANAQATNEEAEGGEEDWQSGVSLSLEKVA